MIYIYGDLIGAHSGLAIQRPGATRNGPGAVVRGGATTIWRWRVRRTG